METVDEVARRENAKLRIRVAALEAVIIDLLAVVRDMDGPRVAAALPPTGVCPSGDDTLKPLVAPAERRRQRLLQIPLPSERGPALRL